MRQNLEVLKESLTTAQERYKRSADRFRKPAPMFKGRVVPPPQPVVIDGQEQFVVEEIIDSRIRRNRLQYLIRWQGYPPEEDSWEPVENINAQQKISRFHQRFPEKPGPGSSSGRF
ncbi:chromobox protein homolog hpl-1-like [Ranitomeya variabilis]|uniref:chromobox protein homolog hpl-1-like n=1 Tax=Ranitomeya variabilis TaxID=490064 RepID=UPI004056B5EB